jgi:hypothetical protein
MADLFRNIQTALPNFGNRNIIPTSSGFSTTSLVYILLGALVIFIIGLMLLNKPIDFSWLDPRPKSMIATSDAYLFWKPSAIFTNLTVKEGDVPGFSNSLYTCGLDVVLKNTRAFSGTEGPWRHIAHRGSAELATTTIGGAILSGGCISAKGAGPLPPFGLPRRMNPGIFLDPNVNDIIVFVDTERGGDNYRESVRIKDIPMDIPFRITVLVNGKVLEVYLNCRLEISKVLSGRPRSVEDVWYGLSGSAAAQAQIQNLYIWKRAVPADELVTLCPAPPKFINERPICNVADSVPSMNIGASKSTASKISYGNSLSSCAAT